MPTPDEQDAYDRGKVDGLLAAKVEEQGQHLDRINGSMEKVATSLADLVLGVSALEQQMAADEKTRISTAQALKDAEEARRTADESKWAPWARVTAIVVAATAVLTLVVLLANHAF
jgi:hypothetical protein